MRTNRWLWALGAALLASCGTYGAPDEVVYGEVVYTQPKPSFDFKPLGTYYIAPTYTSFDAGGDPVLPPLEIPANVKAAIDTGMTGFGYTAAGTITGADVALTMTVLDATQAVYYPGYWCDYYYYYSCYYDYYYAGSYKFGAAILEMADVRGVSVEGDPVPVVWSAVVYGVASTPAYDTERVASGMARAFSQSQYLDTK